MRDNLEKEILKLNEELENLTSEVKTLKSIDKNQPSTKCLVKVFKMINHF